MSFGGGLSRVCEFRFVMCGESGENLVRVLEF